MRRIRHFKFRFMGNNNKLFKLIFFSFILLFKLYTVDAQSWKTELDSVLTIIANEEMFHGHLLVGENGQILFNKAYGNKDNGDRITNQTSLDIQSVTKAFTALSILILQDRKLLNLNNKLTDYFPELPYNEVTIRNLLSMTSGLPRFLPTVIQHCDTTKLIKNNEIIRIVSKYQPVANAPNMRFEYNDDNYMLLASIVEKVSQVSFATFVQKNIFKPLNMNKSHVYESGKHKDNKINSSNFYSPYGSGNIYSTAEDLYIFEQALYTDQLLSHTVLNESFNFTKLKDGTISNYGFAWRLYENGDTFETYIVGDGENTRASIQRFINKKKTLIYIHNISGKNWKKVYGVIRNIWENKPYEMPQKRIIYVIEPNHLIKYIGQYLTKNFGLLHITEENGKLYLRPDPIPEKEELVPSSETTFYFSNQAIEWEFFLDEKGKIIGLGLKGKPETMGPKQ